MKARLPALAALALPVLAGAGWMWLGGAPEHFAPFNLAVFAVALLWAAFGRVPPNIRIQRIATAVLLALMFLPLLTGPTLNSSSGVPVSRWLPLGPVSLNTGLFAIPALAVLAARENNLAAPILLTAIFAAMLQPDAGAGFALTLAAVGLHHVTKDWRVGLTAILGFFATLVMVVRGKLPALPFVERVVVEAFAANPWAALALALALLASFLLMLFAAPLERAARFALAGSLFGFVAMAAMAAYPSPLIGYGGASILGFGLALGLIRKPAP
ncbi:hypothetical protein [Paraurantiacibacter namhicola]|uniref:Uncharacterized protein n=1 Tax=Paraurantiacibacter namhicola TaxID=645517 RepID=A0A1C7D862_9SPHN|nr:hypothetical protein [Paraurantiacibacter namhicola]ANU07648.1 hypothetical protein A6F65_01342 [Paraurantiacibacter namhicola]